MLRKILIFILIFTLGAVFGYAYFNSHQKAAPAPQAEKNSPKAFIGEIYDKIKDNYWNNLSDAELLNLFKLAMDKNGGQISVAKFESKDKLLSSIPTNASSSYLSAVAGAVLASLPPAGRSGLYTAKLEEQLKNTVENINPEKDLYKDLGVAKGASEGAVLEAYQKLPPAQKKLEQIAYAKDTLTEKDKKERYDQKGVEPTIFTRIISSNILYLQFKKFSPTSLDEFQKAFEQHKDNSQLSSLILDLRGNIGGAIDATAYFLGFFLGKNQYAFDFYHKGEYLPFKTPTDKLSSIQKYKQIVVLVDQATQSSAEMLAASLKKYHVGVVVGVPTRGWGSVERVFPLDNQIDPKEKYSIFLVHSITLRDDNQPIEGRGVDPDINIKNPNWEQQLFSYFKNQPLIGAIKSII